MTPVIGITSCIFEPDPERPIFKGKRLLYMEESMFHWVQRSGAVTVMLPTSAKPKDVDALVSKLDGILFSGGVDVAPESYGESAISPEWTGDLHRDQYELALFHAAFDRKLPMLGVCRGHQLLNVALGGTLYQDIQTQNEGALLHRNWEIYEHNFHEVRIEGVLSELYAGATEGKINSVHHQSVKDLGKKLVAEAWSKDDGIVEAMRLEDVDHYIRGVQWHPEFQNTEDHSLLDPDTIMGEFLAAVKEYM